MWGCVFFTIVGVIGFAHTLNTANLHMCVHENEREREREGVRNKKCVRDGASLFMRTPQTNSLCFSMLHQMHFIFLEHTDRNQFWGNGEPGFVCLGQDGTV